MDNNEISSKELLNRMYGKRDGYTEYTIRHYHDVVGKSAEELKPKTKAPRPATKKQLEYLQKLMQQHGNTPETMNKYVKQTYGVDDFTKITGIQASEIIEKYKALEQ